MGVALASASDLTFNWTGFISAMVSNLTFGFRAVWSKKCAPPADLQAVNAVHWNTSFAYTSDLRTSKLGLHSWPLCSPRRQHIDAASGVSRQDLAALTISFTCRAMSNIKDLDSTAIYAYTTLISVLICVPAALIFEGPKLQAAAAKAVESHPDFYFSLFLVGLLYHLYNQVRASESFSTVMPVHVTVVKGQRSMVQSCREMYAHLAQNFVGPLAGHLIHVNPAP